MSVVTQKQALRAEGKQKRRMLDRTDADRRILQRLLKTEEFRRSDLLLCFVSVASEADTRPLLAHCFVTGKRVAVPRCEADGVMHFHEIRSLDSLSPSAFGIPEPDASAPIPECSEKTLCVVPGLLFDRTGHRLGYGGGYYDRFLAAFPGVTVGLCYEALLCERLPHEPFDRKVSKIITEERILTIQSKETAYG